MTERYSRQILFSEIGAAGQLLLTAIARPDYRLWRVGFRSG